MYNEIRDTGRECFWRLWGRSLLAGAILLVMLAGTRLVFTYLYRGQAGEQFWSFWLPAFKMGLRFDLKWAGIFTIVLLFVSALVSLAGVLFVRLRGWRHTLWELSAFCCFFTVFLLGVSNIYYFQFFSTPINPIVFGLLEDDTYATLLSIWHDYPVLKGLLGGAAISLVALWLTRPGAKMQVLSGKKLYVKVLAAFVTIVFLFVFARGSFGKFPLRHQDAFVSTNTLVNAAVPNGVSALYAAYGARQRMTKLASPEEILRQFGFSSPLEAAKVLGWQGANEQELLDTMLGKNEKPVISVKSPHVVVAVMEAWSRELFDYDVPGKNDLLGSFRNQLATGYYFKRAISVGHGTFASLEGLFYDSPVSPLTEGEYSGAPFLFAEGRYWKKAGYRTVFLTGNAENWRNLNVSLTKQGFDEVLGQAWLQAQFPSALKFAWGIDDEYTFKGALKLLADADAKGEKLFIVVLSTTNHPPYHVPDGYAAGKIDTAFLPQDKSSDENLLRQHLTTYQYANNVLGDTLAALRSSTLAGKTIFAATGDHNIRSLINYPDNKKLFFKYGVPIYFSLPPSFAPATLPDLSAWAGHRDIFPTLRALALGEKPRFGGGRNLFVKAERPYAVSFIQDAVDPGVLISEAGAVVDFASPHYLTWRQDGLLEENVAATAELKQLDSLARAQLALAWWRIRMCVDKK